MISTALQEKADEATPGHEIRLGISVLNYTSGKLTARLVDHLDEIMKRTGLYFKILVVDNSSVVDPDEAAILRVHCRASGVDYVASPNVGYSAGHNIAIANLIADGCTHYWLLNPDVDVELTDALEFVLGLRQMETIHCLGWTPGEREDEGVGHLSLTSTRSRPGVGPNRLSVAFPRGHSIILTRDIIDRLEGLDEVYFLFYEEVDLVMRCGRAAVTLLRIPGVTVRHNQGSAATNSGISVLRRDPEITYHSARSCLIFYRRHFPALVLVATVMRGGQAVGALMCGRVAVAISMWTGILHGLAASRKGTIASKAPPPQ